MDAGKLQKKLFFGELMTPQVGKIIFQSMAAQTTPYALTEICI